MNTNKTAFSILSLRLTSNHFNTIHKFETKIYTKLWKEITRWKQITLQGNFTSTNVSVGIYIL